MKKRHYILGIIFVLTLTTHLVLAFQTPHFTGEESYFALKQIENIKTTGMPLFYDELSYGGKDYVFAPFFYYFLAFFNVFLPIGIVGKVVPNLLISLCVLLVFLISKNISNDDDASLFSAFIAGFIPVFYSETTNTISVYTLVFPMFLLLIYCFLNIHKRDYAYLFLVILFLLILTSPAVVILLLGLVFYMFLVRLENLNQSKIEVEVIIFSLVLTTWILFLIFKNAFLLNGPAVIWQNIPKEILNNYFLDVTMLGAIYQIGSLPLSYAVYSVYDNLFRIKQRKLYLIIGIAFSTMLLLWFRLIEVALGLMCIGIVATLLLPKFYKFTFSYIKKTRFAKLSSLYFVTLLAAFIIASVIPSIVSGMNAVNSSLSDNEYNAFVWMKKYTPPESVIMTSAEEGIYVSSIAHRTNVADTRFMLQKDAEQRIMDIGSLYKTKFETEALGILNKYDVDYVYLSDNSRDQFGIDNLKYAQDIECFDLKYDKDVKIYKVLCELK